MIGHPGVRFVTMNEMADDFARRSPRQRVTRQRWNNERCAHCAEFWVARSTGPTPSPGPGVFTRNTDAASRRRERMKQVAAANRVLKHYRMNLADWQGSAFVLSTATGKTEIVDNLGHLWTAVERLIGRPCDPLDAGTDHRNGTRSWLTLARFHAGDADHRLSRLGQDDAVATTVARPGTVRHRRIDQRIRRDWARPSSARTYRRDDGDAAIGLRLLHDPRRAFGCDQGPAFAARTWSLAAFRRLVIESTGLADPYPILSTVRSDPVLRHHFCLGNVITTVDAVNGARQLDLQPESVKQVAVADRLVLTKTDLATAEETTRLTPAPAPHQFGCTALARD